MLQVQTALVFWDLLEIRAVLVLLDLKEFRAYQEHQDPLGLRAIRELLVRRPQDHRVFKVDLERQQSWDPQVFRDIRVLLGQQMLQLGRKELKVLLALLAELALLVH